MAEPGPASAAGVALVWIQEQHAVQGRRCSSFTEYRFQCSSAVSSIVQDTGWQAFSFGFTPADTINQLAITVDYVPGLQRMHIP